MTKPLPSDIQLVTSTIQSAIDALPSTGGLVYIPSGTYTEALVDSGKSNVVLMGEGIGITIIQTPTNSAGINLTGATGSSNYVDGWKIQDLTIKGNNDVSQTSNYGIYLKWVKNFTLQNVRIEDVYSNYWIDLQDGKINELTIYNTKQHGLRLSCADSDASCIDVDFVKLTIDTTGGVGQGFYIYRGTDLGGGTYYLPSRIRVHSGVIKNTAEAGYRNEGNDCLVTVDTYNTGRAGVRFSGDGKGGARNIATGCHIYYSSQTTDANGFYIDDANGTVIGSKLLNSTIYRTKSNGVCLGGGTDIVIANNTIIDAGYGTGSTSNDGIFLNAGGASPVNVVRPVIVGNTIIDTQSGASRTTGYGIDITQSGASVQDAVVVGNRAYNTVLGDYDTTLPATSDTFIWGSDSNLSSLGDTNLTTSISVNQRWDGWTDTNDTMSYASASTINSLTGSTSRYQKGDWLKITQTTDKFFKIIDVADTLLTVDGFGTYTVANSAITNPQVSVSRSPYGVPVANLFDNNTELYANAIVNGDFNVWQRNYTFTSPANNTCTADRFKIVFDVDTGTAPTLVHSQQTPNSGTLSGSNWMYRIAPNGAGTGYGANSYYAIVHPIEQGTRKFGSTSSRQITINVKAKTSISNKKMGIYLVQNYGSGGSPSANENITGTYITLNGSFQDLQKTFTLNTLSGKTFGTSNDDALYVVILLQWGSSKASLVGDSSAESFVGSGNIDIGQVVGNRGFAVANYYPKPVGVDEMLCMRYYEKSYGSAYAGSTTSTSAVTFNASGANMASPTVFYKVPKRLFTPTVTVYSTSTGTAGQIRNQTGAADTAGTVDLSSDKSFRVTSTNSDTNELRFHWTSDAEFSITAL